MRCVRCLLVLLSVLLAGCRGQPVGVWGGKPTDRVARILEQYHQPPTPPDEVFVLETSYPGGGPGDAIELTVRDGVGELRLYREDAEREPNPRYYRRMLSASELAGFRRFVEANGIDRMPGIEHNAEDGVAFHWTHVVHGFGRTVYINNPDEGTTCDRLDAYLRHLADTRRMAVVYTKGLEPGLELLFGQHERPVDRVWAKGDDIRVRMAGYDEDRGKWMRLNKGMLAPAEAPAGFDDGDFDSVEWDRWDIHGYWDQQPALARIRYRDGYIRGAEGPDISKATWFCKPDGTVERLFDKPISSQLVTPSGKLVGTLDHRLVIFDLEARKFIPIHKEEAALNSFAYLYIPERKRVLTITRDIGFTGRAQADFRMLDPETGLSRKCYLGSLDGMNAAGTLIPSSRVPGSYWVASPSAYGPGTTSLMRLNTATMQFDGWGKFIIHGISFTTDGLWADDDAGLAYCVYKGHVFRIAIPAKAYEPDPPWMHGPAMPEPQDE